MDITITDIEKYLEEVKAAINAGCYRIEMNDNRKDNQDLFLDYIISEEKRKQILDEIKAQEGVEKLMNLVSNKKYKINVQFKLK